MVNNNYTLWNLIKKVWDLLSFLVEFFTGRKQKKIIEKTTDELKNNYNAVDKQNEEKKKDDIQKRLNDMF
jgi:hypothetical protein